MEAITSTSQPVRPTSAGLGREETASSQRHDAAANRERILAAAAALFQERGVDEVSMHQIAMAAGIGQGTLYRNFIHKGELCSALAAQAVEKLTADVSLDLARTDTGSLEALYQVLERFVEFGEQFAPMICGIVDAACGTRRMALYRSPLYAWMYGTVSGLLSRAMAEGEIENLDVEYTADALLALLDINLRLFQHQDRGFEHERILRGLRTFVTRALLAPARAQE